MAFGQQSGPPAGHRQLQELLELVIEAGHVDFRDARGPLGLTQRQGGGKFTREEADELIARLRAEAEANGGEDLADEPADRRYAPRAARPAPKQPTAAPGARNTPGSAPSGAVAAARARLEAEWARKLRDAPAELLAAELQRRGWAVIEP
jgi:hypothetical protein